MFGRRLNVWLLRLVFLFISLSPCLFLSLSLTLPLPLSHSLYLSLPLSLSLTLFISPSLSLLSLSLPLCISHSLALSHPISLSVSHNIIFFFSSTSISDVTIPNSAMRHLLRWLLRFAICLYNEWQCNTLLVIQNLGAGSKAHQNRNMNHNQKHGQGRVVIWEGDGRGFMVEMPSWKDMSWDSYGMKSDFPMILVFLGVHSKCLVQQYRKHAYQGLV